MDIPSRNEVALVGRLAAPVLERQLPSGDTIAVFRLVVPRPVAAPRQRPRSASRSVTIDTVDCVARTAALRRSVLSWQPGDAVELDGALHRRFWRGPAGPTSRYEVEVHRVRRLAKAS